MCAVQWSATLGRWWNCMPYFSRQIFAPFRLALALSDQTGGGGGVKIRIKLGPQQKYLINSDPL